MYIYIWKRKRPLRGRSGQKKGKQTEHNYFRLELIPGLTCIYMSTCLFTYIYGHCIYIYARRGRPLRCQSEKKKKNRTQSLEVRTHPRVDVYIHIHRSICIYIYISIYIYIFKARENAVGPVWKQKKKIMWSALCAHVRSCTRASLCVCLLGLCKKTHTHAVTRV